MPGPVVMLASAVREPVDRVLPRLIREGWWFELKYDGIRAVAHRNRGGRVTLYGRRQSEITHRYPDIVGTLRRARFVGWLDGEIIVTDADGRPDFPSAHLRDMQSKPAAIRRLAAQRPATFMPFDVLEENGNDTRAMPYTLRHEVLVEMVSPCSVASQDGETMWQFASQRNLEGLIAKRGDAPYRPGRQHSWIKLKATHRVFALVGGVKAGKGSRGPVGALELYLFDPDAGALVSIGSVGSGMSVQDQTRLHMRVLARRPTVVEVSFLEVSKSGQLRMPVFVAIRSDVDPTTCTIDTLKR
jgi:bifunctional non-homologous end joining protein LigD